MKILLTCFLLISATIAGAQNSPVIATGAMRNTIFHGQTAGLLSVDSLTRPGMYGLGPLEELRGELLLWDGNPYVATVDGLGAMILRTDSSVRAPFFVHQHVTEWLPVELPDTVQDLAGVDAFLTTWAAGSTAEPFAFTLVGAFTHLAVHILDVPEGTRIAGPDDMRPHKPHFETNGDAQVLGFFSTRHHRVFTHHDSNIHTHALAVDGGFMGHVEELRFAADKVELRVALMR